MTRSVTLDARQRQALLDRYRKDPDPEARFRAHILLLLADGHTWATVAALLFCSSRTIDRWVKRFHRRGGGPGRAQARPPLSLRRRLDRRRRRMGHREGPARLRLPPQPLVLRGRRLLMLRDHHVEVSRETVRRWLHRGGLVYRRPRPVLGPTDEQRGAKLAELRKLLAELPEDETAVFQDEVDINTNPKIGSMWMATG